jgi:hypothetical protein
MKTADEFWAKVDKTDGCWNWKGGTDGSGRGILTWQDRREYAYRVAYVISKGQIPNGARLTQTCKNLRCVRFEHLRDKAQVIAKAEASPPIPEASLPAPAAKVPEKSVVTSVNAAKKHDHGKPIQPQEPRLLALLVEFQKEIEKMEKERDQGVLDALELRMALESVCSDGDAFVRTLGHVRGLLSSPSVIKTTNLAKDLMGRIKEKKS